MLINCDICRARGTDACDDCVVNFLLTEGKAELNAAESRALDDLAAAGLVPPLRMVLSDRDASGF